MSKMENQAATCRFCFKTCDGKLKSIEGSLEEMLDTLLLKTSSTVSESPLICTSCEVVVSRCFEFKSTCLFMQTNIISNIDIDNGKANPKGVANTEDLNTCTLCMAVLKSCHFISFNNVDEEMLDQVFESCIPELDLSVTTKPAICKACFEHLQIYFNLMIKCSILQKTSMDDNGIMSPGVAQTHTLSSDICERNENDAGIIKIERTFYEEEERESDNKDGVLKFTSENMLTGNSLIEVAEIKTEETFCEKLENEEGLKQSGRSLTAVQDMLICTTREIYEPNEFKIEGVICEEKEDEFDRKIYSEMEDTKCIDVLQFTSMNVTCDGGGIKTEETENEVKHEIFLVDHKLNNVQLCSKNALKYEDYGEEGNERFTETDVEKVLPRSLEKVEIVLNDPRNFDSLQDGEIFPQKNPNFNLPKMQESPSTQPHRTHPQVLFQRQQLIHKNFSKIYTCEQCSFESKHKQKLKDHLLTHKNSSEITMYRCEHCSFQTKLKGNLKSHLLCHKKPSEIIMYQCEHCSFQTKNKGSFRYHFLIHKSPSEITMYQCEHCSYQTKLKGNLKGHLLTHKNPSEIIMYQCEHCSFQTKYKGSFRYHHLTHKSPSEITMYQCEHCAFQTKNKWYLKSHFLLNHKMSKVNTYRCEHCYRRTEKTFVRSHFFFRKNPSAMHTYQCEHCSLQTKYKRCR